MSLELAREREAFAALGAFLGSMLHAPFSPVFVLGSQLIQQEGGANITYIGFLGRPVLDLGGVTDISLDFSV